MADDEWGDDRTEWGTDPTDGPDTERADEDDAATDSEWRFSLADLEDDEEGDNADGLSLYGEVKAGSPSAEHAVFVALGFALGLIAIWQLLP
ncbi:hypothetical protein Huta_2913 [Halorhabdus utahensis DSM 12940]|uniref:DUF7312 domain-containing protein n=1 Tax=Halorhabdus utahensis (strain DSM 12940 / JCM 11049 / AX-2) TaxID=519442 RepID=C7NRW9_HALUD|nr:hypothetical protein [Halorhabdus utahensis]ACV13074.1 hypothetical protein Huta_2913 [Halorhabdus utahensis DSM 12940]